MGFKAGKANSSIKKKKVEASVTGSCGRVLENMYILSSLNPDLQSRIKINL